MSAMSIPLRVLICDDELMARKRVLRLLGEIGGIEATIEKSEEADKTIAIIDPAFYASLADVRINMIRERLRLHVAKLSNQELIQEYTTHALRCSRRDCTEHALMREILKSRGIGIQ